MSICVTDEIDLSMWQCPHCGKPINYILELEIGGSVNGHKLRRKEKKVNE